MGEQSIIFNRNYHYLVLMNHCLSCKLTVITPCSGHGWQLTLNGQSQIGPNRPFGLNRNGSGHLVSNGVK